ncbi:MAG: transcriptional repressor [Patescibacteria group bacterium]|nr:transcriptional repressor [Patescibacteria group bacterium]
MIKKHDCKEELRQVNLKVTPARLGVLAALESASSPLDAGNLTSYLSGHGIKVDRVTVFRIINILTDRGLAKPVLFDDGKLRYDYGSRPEHHHFVCEKCGRVEMVSNCVLKPLEKKLQKTKGFFIRRHSLEFFGLCAECLK